MIEQVDFSNLQKQYKFYPCMVYYTWGVPWDPGGIFVAGPWALGPGPMGPGPKGQSAQRAHRPMAQGQSAQRAPWDPPGETPLGSHGPQKSIFGAPELQKVFFY